MKCRRQVIFDFANEHKGLYVNSIKDFDAWYKLNGKKDDAKIIIRYPIDADSYDVIDLTSHVALTFYHDGIDQNKKTLLFFEEAQFYFPTHSHDESLKRILTVGRHANFNIIANTQRPALVSKTLFSLADRVYIGQLFESNDIKYLQKAIGDSALSARTLQKYEFIEWEPGIDSESHKIIKAPA